MKKVKYYYNKNTLRYERIEDSATKRLLQVMAFVVTAFIMAFVMVVISYKYIKTQKEATQRAEIEGLKKEINAMDGQLEQITAVLSGLEKRDNEIYREIFGAEKVSESVRSAGVGGADRYRYLNNLDNKELLVETRQKIDQMKKRLVVQSKSYDDIAQLIQEKEKMLVSIPAIMPVSSKDLTRVASGYGMRIHPIYKRRKMHWGMDFTAPTGTRINATGDGKIVKVKYSRRGYGNVVEVDHGYGYLTRYAHMSRIDVKRGQKIKRGQQLGAVGNTGTSTAPHLHYEVEKNGQKVNPINYYFNDLTPEEYDKMIEISSSHNQSFD